MGSLSSLSKWVFPAVLIACNVLCLRAQVNPVPGDPLTGSGNVSRSVLTYSTLFSSSNPSSPVDDTSGFGLPANAAAPSQAFEGTLTLNNTASNGNFKDLYDPYAYGSVSAWKHLGTFSFQFVQNGSYFIPAKQGLVITGGDWNYVIGPGRVWNENSDDGYTRVSFPFALIELNQNCTHNGEMTFLLSNTATPHISNVYYQITQETCEYYKFNMWGEISATYTQQTVSNDTALENAEAAEVSNRLPTKPFSALTTDYPNAGLVLSNFTKAFSSPSDITTYGLVINGTNYSSGNNCQTRYGNYAFCSELRLPSYSVAKSAFADTALMRLGELYGTGVYSQLIKSYFSTQGGNWNSTTFANTSDMATGNYNSSSYETDESSAAMSTFLDAESYSSKNTDAFAFKQHYTTPGTLWVYQSAATYILTQGMNAYLQQQQGSGADIFNLVRDSVYTPINLSQGAMTMIRTDDNATGHPTGYYGLFLIQDDIGKLGSFLNNGNGVISGRQVLESTRLQQSLFRESNPSGTALLTSMVTDPDTGKAVYPNSMYYKDDYWGKKMTPGEFSQYSCTFWVPFMSGYGGNTVLLLPNGVTYYIFSDGGEFHWYDAVNEINKIVPLCPSSWCCKAVRRALARTGHGNCGLAGSGGISPLRALLPRTDARRMPCKTL